MVDELGRSGLLLTALVLLGLLSGVGAACAQGIYGTLQLQFQRSEDVQQRLSGDSVLTSRTMRSQWVRSLDLHQQSYLRSDLMLDSNLRLSEQLLGGSHDFARTPQGTMRLVHPWFQVTVQHQPSVTRTTVPALTGTAADTLPRRTLQTRVN